MHPKLDLFILQKQQMSFSALKKQLESVLVDILGPLMKTNGGYLFNLTIADLCTSVRQVVPFKRRTDLDVAEEHT